MAQPAPEAAPDRARRGDLAVADTRALLPLTLVRLQIAVVPFQRPGARRCRCATLSIEWIGLKRRSCLEASHD